MLELVEEVEHLMRAARLARPVVHDARLHRLRRAARTRPSETPHACRSRRATSSCSTSARSSTATARTSAAPSASASRRPEVREAYELVLAAQEAGRAALRPGVPASEVNRACRQPIEEAGLRRALQAPHGSRDRPGRPRAPVRLRGGRDAARGRHDLHRRAVDPRRRRFGVRIEDVVVCEPEGGRKLNAFPPDLIVNA